MLPANFMKVDIEAHVKSGRGVGDGRQSVGGCPATMPNGIVSCVVVLLALCSGFD